MDDKQGEKDMRNILFKKSVIAIDEPDIYKELSPNFSIDGIPSLEDKARLIERIFLFHAQHYRRMVPIETLIPLAKKIGLSIEEFKKIWASSMNLEYATVKDIVQNNKNLVDDEFDEDLNHKWGMKKCAVCKGYKDMTNPTIFEGFYICGNCNKLNIGIYRYGEEKNLTLNGKVI